MYKIVLASSSPRRQTILQKAGFAFRTFSVEISENISENMSLDDALMALSRRKAEAVYQTYGEDISDHAILLAADTIVEFEGNILGKPKDQAEAKCFLSKMAGNMHLVKTAFCLWNLKLGEQICDIETSVVYFKPLDTKFLQAYINSEEPYDKAGAYGIQGKGKGFVEKYEGSLNNIIGLPIEKIQTILNKKKWQCEREV